MYTPCRECHEKGENFLGCHATCQRYIEWKSERDAIKNEVLKKAEIAQGCRELNRNRMRSFGKISGNKRGARVNL